MDRLADLNRDAEVTRFITGRQSSIDETAVELKSHSAPGGWSSLAKTGGSSAGAARYREEVLSYLFFHPEFIDGAIRLGQNDGRRSLDSAGGVRRRFTGESAATA